MRHPKEQSRELLTPGLALEFFGKMYDLEHSVIEMEHQTL